MNLCVITILLLTRMTEAAPTSPAPRPTAQPQYIHPSPDDAPVLNFKRQGDDWWRSFAIALAELRGGVSIRNVVSIKIDGEETSEKFIPPPPPKDSEFDTADQPSNMAGSRSLLMGSPRNLIAPRSPTSARRASPAVDKPRSYSAPKPEPLTGDIGVCSTLIKGPSPKFTGKIYKTGRLVTLHKEIAPFDISCRSNVPVSGHGNGSCVVVAYPHGVWVRARPEDFRYHNLKNCYDIKGSSDKQCWDYIKVNGYCVLQKKR